jgi:hypothetical protein
MADPDDQLPAEQPREKKRRGNYGISPRLAKTLVLLASGEAKTQVDACEVTGLTTRALQKALRRPNVKQYMIDHIQSTLAIGATRAANKMCALLDSDNSMVSFRAAAYTLATGAGVAPPERPGTTVNILNAGAAGYLIDLRDDHESPADGVTHLSLGPAGGVLEGPRVLPPLIEGEAKDVTPVVPLQPPEEE